MSWFVGGPVRETILGMELDVWQTAGGDCRAEFGVGDDWATLYSIRSATEGKGQATEILKAARSHYVLNGKKFGSSVALNERMRGILQHLDIPEYK
jgi:hypothetical protein